MVARSLGLRVSMKFKFNPSISGFDIQNSLSMALASRLAYEDADKIKAGLAETGMDCWNFIDEGGTQAYVFRIKNLVVLAFRGTDSTADVFLDAKATHKSMSAGTFHSGFLEAFNFASEPIIDSMAPMVEKHTAVVVTGHSMGGALAMLSNWFLPFHISQIYTFGCPRFMCQMTAGRWERTLKEKAFRFFHNNDVVPRIPPSRLDWAHCGHRMYITHGGGLIEDPGYWDLKWDRIVGRFLYRWENPFAFKTDGLADHEMDGYVRALENISQKETDYDTDSIFSRNKTREEVMTAPLGV